MSSSREKIDVRVWMDRKLYEELLRFVVHHYGHVRGQVSKVIEDAVREYLRQHS